VKSSNEANETAQLEMKLSKTENLERNENRRKPSMARK
jgi:hypothetical protein